MTVKDLHNKAMEFNDQAIIAISKGEDPKSLYQKAFEFEKQAYNLYASKSDEEPTRSVLLRSAASLAMMADLFEDAEKLIAIAISGNPPIDILEELRSLNSENIKHLNKRNLPFNVKIVPVVKMQQALKIGDTISVSIRNLNKGVEQVEIHEGEIAHIFGAGSKQIITIVKVQNTSKIEFTIPLFSPNIISIEVMKNDLSKIKERILVEKYNSLGYRGYFRKVHDRLNIEYHQGRKIQKKNTKK